MIRNIDHANVIHYGEDTLVIKSATQDKNGPACIKILNEEFPEPEKLGQLEREFEVCSKTNSYYIRKALRKELHDDHVALVMEYVSGKTLLELLTEKHYELNEQLKLATEIASLSCSLSS